MPVAVVTRTLVARPRYVAAFALRSLGVGLQTRRSPGYVAGALRVTAGPVFWTLTVWRDGRAMNRFRDSGAHAAAMPRLAGWADQGTFTAWRTEDDRRPTWSEAEEQLALRPRFTPLDRPDEAHRTATSPSPGGRGVSFSLPAPRQDTVRR